MPRKQHIVRLYAFERRDLQFFVVHRGPTPDWARQRARILLRADVGGERRDRTDQQIAEALGVAPRTVARARAAWCRRGWAALGGRGRRPRKVAGKLSRAQQTRLIAVARSQPPEGYGRWPLRLLAKRAVELGIVDSISHETVRQTLKKWNSVD